MKRKVTKKKIRKIRKTKMKAGALALLLVAVFCLFSAVLAFQRNYINQLDAQIMQLESEYDNAKKLNDDLQGQLMQSRNLSEIEQYATKTLGMVKPSSKNITYVSYSDPKDPGAEASGAQKRSSFFDWISALFK